MKKQTVFFIVILIISVLGMISISSFYHVDNSGEDRELRIGLIINGHHDDGGVSQVNYDAVNAVAMDKDYVFEYYENVPYSEECRDDIEDLISDGCNFIILGSSYFENYGRAAAVEHPDVFFLGFNGKTYKQNLETFTGRLYQAQYLTGIVAGMKTEKNKIAYYSDDKSPELVCGINAFTLGVKKVNPDAEVIVKYASKDKSTEEAVDHLITEHGTDVFTCNGNSDSPLQYADREGVWTIGVHQDNSRLYPNTYLTAAVWDLKAFYAKQLYNYEEGLIVGENFYPGIDDGIVDIAALTDNVGEDIAKVVERERNQLIFRHGGVFRGPIYDNTGELKLDPSEMFTDRELLSNTNYWYVAGVVLDE